MDDVKDDISNFINDDDDDDVPDFVRTFKPKSKNKNSDPNRKTYKELANMSSFHILFQPNLGMRPMDTEQKRVDEYKRLKRFIKLLKSQWEDGKLLKERVKKGGVSTKFVVPKVLRFEYKIEIGEQTGIHTHIVLSLDGMAFIDLTAVRTLYDAHNYSKAKFNAKSVQLNTSEILLAYQDKQQDNKVVDTMENIIKHVNKPSSSDTLRPLGKRHQKNVVSSYNTVKPASFT
jgi:hypothetical protein